VDEFADTSSPSLHRAHERKTQVQLLAASAGPVVQHAHAQSHTAEPDQTEQDASEESMSAASSEAAANLFLRISDSVENIEVVEPPSPALAAPSIDFSELSPESGAPSEERPVKSGKGGLWSLERKAKHQAKVERHLQKLQQKLQQKEQAANNTQ
jgi:hypothetical protein